MIRGPKLALRALVSIKYSFEIALYSSHKKIVICARDPV